MTNPLTPGPFFYGTDLKASNNPRLRPKDWTPGPGGRFRESRRLLKWWTTGVSYICVFLLFWFVFPEECLTTRKGSMVPKSLC